MHLMNVITGAELATATPIGVRVVVVNPDRCNTAIGDCFLASCFTFFGLMNPVRFRAQRASATPVYVPREHAVINGRDPSRALLRSHVDCAT
jgi:hypothetical protein